MRSGEESHWRAIGTLLRPEARRYAALGLLVALGAALPVAGPLILGRLVDAAAEGAELGRLTRLVAVFLVLAVAAQVVQVIIAWVATKVAWTTSNRLRVDLVRHVIGLDRSFHTRHTPGELTQRIDGDVTSLSDFLSGVLVKVGGALLMMLGMIVALTWIDVRVGLAMALYIALSLAAVVRLRDKATEESVAEMSADAAVFGGIEERLAATDDLRANGAGNYAITRFLADSDRLSESSTRRHIIWAEVWGYLNLVVVGGLVLAVAGGALAVSAGWITIGTAFIAFQYVQLLRRPLDQVIEQIEAIQKAAGGMRRALELLRTKSALATTGDRFLPEGPLDIDLTGVGVDYGDGVPALNDVSLRLGAGRSLGLVGRTGSGKTTLSRLVLRQIDPSAGRISLGGLPMPDIELDHLRRRVALVPQEVRLLAGSVRDNVALFDSNVPDSAVSAALREVGLEALADGGLDREVGTDGRSLSAGEGQLLALARAWIRDPDVIVFDEATARVDPATEARIEAAVRRILHGRTAIVIAHRLSTLEHMDEIAVLDGGRLVEHGERENLARDAASHYADLRRRSASSTQPELA